ncbi:MAG TPA: ROK family protein [Candidatus Krumholzibacteria bacterium]|nr:ROK family protein [Candidatus Krumholzibacteria bacterium]
MEILGIDVGGRGIKGAVVETTTGELVEPRMRLRTPQPATPEAVAAMIGELVAHFEWSGTVGVGFPAVVRDHVVRTAANIDESWIGVDVVQLFEDHATCNFVVANDADAAGLAEMQFGAGRGHTGVALVLTVGTGIGSALFVDGRLVPNTEFGHLEIRGYEAEAIASGAVRQRKQLSWPKWAKRMNRVLATYESLVSPDLIVFGGGISKKAERFMPLLETEAPIVPAAMRNLAGIVGAALLAAEHEAHDSDGSLKRLSVWTA